MRGRVPALAVVLLLACAWRATTPNDIAFLKRIPAPASEEAAQEAARAWVLDRLDDPRGAEFTFRPAVRSAYWALSINGPVPGIWMCGTVRAQDRYGWQVYPWDLIFDAKRPGQVWQGSVGNDRYGRFIPPRCDELYRDGFPAFPKG